MQFGISYISSILKEEGHETRLVVPTRESDDAVFEHIRDFNPGLICFTSVYTVFDLISEVAARVKKRHPDIFLAAGGPHASLRPEECLEAAFDAVCVGEGEYPTLELVEQLESGLFPQGIPNFFIKRDGGVERNPTRPFLEDIEALPFPDREMWLPWVANPLSRPSVLAGRGFTPTAGMTVTAWVGGKLCAQSRAMDVDGQVVYSVHVLADGPGGAAGCGAPGRTVTFQVGSRVYAPTAAWDNRRLWELPLHPAWRVYLPLILRH